MNTNNPIFILALFAMTATAPSEVWAESANDWKDSISKADAITSQGSVVYKRESKGRSHKITMTYDQDRKFKLWQLPLPDRKLETQTQLPISYTFDGKDTYLQVNSTSIKKGRSYVDILSGKPDEVRDSYRETGGLCPMPCWVFGRGLSFLKVIHVTEKDSHLLTIEGQCSIGTTIRAILDARHGYVAKQIEREKEGRVFLRMVLGAPTLRSPNIWIASSATTLFANGDKFTETDRYTLLNANFNPPGDSSFNVVLKKGLLVLDNRLGKQVAWDMKFDRDGKSLLGKTRTKLKELTALQAQIQAAEQRQHYIRLSLIFLPLSLLAFLFFWKQRHAGQLQWQNG